jgi:hypothetical protein
MGIMRAASFLLQKAEHLMVAIIMALYFVGSVAAQSSDAEFDAAENLVEARLILSLPAALQTGLSTGVGATYTRGSDWLAWGVKASWSTATEYTLVENVRNDDIRFMLFGVAQYAAGRGTIALRLGAGGVLVYEERNRSQGARAGLKGSALRTTAWAALPGADLEFVVKLRILDAWSMIVSGGPACYLLKSELHPGWLAGLGVAWQD